MSVLHPAPEGEERTIHRIIAAVTSFNGHFLFSSIRTRELRFYGLGAGEGFSFLLVSFFFFFLFRFALECSDVTFDMNTKC